MAIRDIFSMTRKRLEDLANKKATTLSPEAQAIKDRYLARKQNTGSATVQAAEPVFTPAVPTAPSISGDTVTRVPAKNRQAAVGTSTVKASALSPEAQSIKDGYLARKQEKRTETQRTELLGGLAEQTGSSYNDLMQRVTEFGERNTDPRKANADEIDALRKEISDLSAHYRDYGNAYDTTYEGSPSGKFLSGLNAADAALAQMQNRKRTWDEMSPFEQLAATAREKIGDRADAYEEYLATDYDIDAAKRQVGDLQNQLDEIKRSTFGNAPAPAGDRYDAEAAYAEKRQQMTDLETRIGQLETEIGKANGIRAERAEAEEYDRVMAPYRALTTSQQFAENNGYHSTRHGEPVRNDFSGVYTDTGFDDILHDYINRNPDAIAAQIAITTNDNTAFLGIAPTQLAFLTDEERDIYNYLYNVQGKEPAQEFLKSIGSYLNERNREAEAMEWSRIATENPISSITSSIVSIPLNAIGGVTGTAAAVADRMQGKEIDPNAGEFRLTRIPAEIRSAVAEKISDTWAGDTGSFLYQTGMSMADFLFTTAVTGGFSGGGKAAEALNLGIMGSTAAANSVLDAKDAGMDDRTAFIIGAIAGAAEIITEKISLESLLDKTNLDKSVRGYILKNILSEGSEEAASDLINIAADIIIAGDQGTFAADVREHGAAQAVLNRLKEIGLDALGGAISGGVMAGAGAAINSGIGVVNPVTTYRTGRDIVENGDVQQLLTDAEGMNPNTGAYRLAGDLNRRFAAKGIDLGTDAEKIGIRATYDVGRLANRVERQTGRDVESLAILRQAAEDMAAEGTVSEESANAVLADRGARRELGLTDRKADDPAKTVTDALTRYRTAQERDTVNTVNDTTKERTTPQTAVNQERSVAIQARDTNAVNDFADSLGKAGKTAVSGLYDAGTDAERYIPAANDYYRAGVRGDGIETVETEYGSVLTEEVKQQIYDAGVTDAERQNDQTTPEAAEKEETWKAGQTDAIAVDTEPVTAYNSPAPVTAETTKQEDMGNGREIRDSDSGERDDGANPGEPVRGVEESAGRDQSESDQRGGEYADPEISEGAFGRKVSTASFGIAGGSTAADVYRYDGTTTALTRAKNEARKRGYSVVAYAGGDMTINGEGGYRGVIDMKNRRIFVRADDATYTAEQLVMHELAHDRIRRGEISVSDVRNRLEKHYGKHYAQEVTVAYEQAYRGSDMTAEQIWTELICDAVAGMNSFDFLAQLRRAGETAANRIRTVAETKPVAETNTAESADVMTEGVHETADGETTAASDGNGHTEFSRRTWREFGRGEYAKALKRLVRGKQLTRADADAMLAEMDRIYQVTEDFADRYAAFGAWSEAEVERNEKGKPVFSVIKANGDYAMNLDFSLVCKKRRALDAVFGELIRRGSLEQFDLEERSIVEINNIIREYGLEVACALCFVDAKRFRQGMAADAFVSLYNTLVRSMAPKGAKIDTFNFGGNSKVNHISNGIDTMADGELDFSEIDRVLKEYGSKTVEYKAAQLLKNNPAQRKLVLRGDFMNTSGFDALTKENPELLKLYNSKKGTGGPKASQSDVQYLGDVLRSTKFTAEQAYSVGGVRIQSFSDYIPRLVFDYCQMVADLSAKKLPAHAYSKEEIFVLQFGKTGIKINMSLVPDVAADGVSPGLDRNGNYLWRDGQSFGSDANVKGSAQTGYERALEIQRADGYTANCGTIAVGVSDAHIRKMLDDPNIRMVIPYHKSSLNHIVAVMNNIDLFENYTDSQNTRGADGKKIDREYDFDFNDALRRTGDAKTAADEYLAFCRDNGYTPKFSQFADSNGYYKLLEDFACYDEVGNATPQGAVTMTFPSEGDPFGSMTDLIEAGLNADDIAQGKIDGNVEKIADRIEAVLPEKEAQFRADDAENAAQKRAKTKDLEFSRRAQSVEELRKENEELRAELNTLNSVRAEARRNAARADYFEGQTKRTKTPTVRAADATKLANTILEEYQSKADRNAVAEAIRNIGNYVVAGEPKTGVIDWNTLRDMAAKTAHTVVASASALREGFDKEKIREIRKYLKGIQIRYRDNGDIADYGIWKKHNASRLKISETAGRSIDSFWADLQEHYGKQFFPDEIQLESEMLMHISDMLDDFRDLYENPFDVDMAKAVEYCANEIIDRAISEELRQTEPTFADKKAAEIAKTRADSLLAGEMAQARADAKRYGKLEREYAKYRENAKEQIAAIREARDRKIATLKKQYAERQKTRIENAAKGAARKKLVSHIKRLSGDLLANSDKHHIPERFRTSVAAILDAIDVGSALYDADGKLIPNTHAATKKTEAFLDLQEQYRDINVNGNMVIDPDLLSTDDADGLIDEVRKISGIPVDAMTLEQLETVQRLVTAIEASIKTFNKVLSQAKAENINEWASTVIKESETAKDVTRFKNFEKIEDMLSVSMLTPEAYFHRWGIGGEWMFRALRDAQDKFTTTMEKVVVDMEKLLGDYNVKTAEKTMHPVKLGGKDVEMSTAQLMELAALYTRKDANGKPTVYEHLTAGGIFLDGKPSGARYKVRTGPIRNVTVEEIENAVALLSPEDVKVIQGLQEYASTALAEVGNEASMAVYGYKKFRESNYWPIRVNGQETRQTVEKDTQVTSVAGYGFTKSLKPKATNSVRVGSAFDTFITHATQMATYASYLAVTEDATRLRNWTVVADDGSRQGNFREAVDKILGSAGSRYFAKLLQDISIGVRGNNTEGPLSSGWFSRFKSATVGANLRVVIQQPTAILRALDMIDMKYFAAGLNPLKAIEGWKKAVKYAPIARWKSWGYFDVGMGRNMKDVVFPTAEKTIDRVRDVGGALAGFADSFAWGQIWNAVEAETRHTQKGLTGDAFNQAVARRFTEIIDHTQVVDGILQRSQIMRDADGLTKMSTSFMSEPIKQYNMFLSAAWDLRHGNTEKSVSRKRFARTAVALTVSGTVNAFVQSIVDAMRHSDREKDYWERLMTEFYGVSGDETAWYDYVKNVMTSNMGDWLNIGNYIPYVREAVSLVEGYSVERMDMEGIAKAISAGISMGKAILGTGSKAAWVYATDLTATVADLFGIPASSLKRDVLSVIEAVVNDFGNDLLKYRFDKVTKNTSSDGNRGGFIDILYHAYRFDRGAYEIMYSDMVRSGIATEEAIAKGMESRMKRDEGVDSVSDLDRRYLSPSQEKTFDRMMSRLSSSELYRSADDEVQNAVEDDAFALAHGDKAITDEAYDAYRNGVSEGNFLLWKLALLIADEENNGNGYYDKQEKQAAVEMLDIRQKAADYLLGR